MPTYVVLTFPGEEMALTETAQCLTDPYAHVEKSAMGGSNDTLDLWISCADLSNVPAALEADSSVSAYECLVATEDERFYTITIEREIVLFREIIHRHEGTIKEAYGTGEEWTIECRFPSRDQLSAANDHFERYGIAVTFQTIEELADSTERRMYDLTDAQREAVEMAMEMGYFEVPRDTTLESIADELDVSHQALSERLRRAYRKLATRKITPPSGRDPAPRAK